MLYCSDRIHYSKILSHASMKKAVTKRLTLQLLTKRLMSWHCNIFVLYTMCNITYNPIYVASYAAIISSTGNCIAIHS